MRSRRDRLVKLDVRKFLVAGGPCKPQNSCCSAVGKVTAARAKPTQKKRSVLSSNGENLVSAERTMKSRSMPTNRTVPDVTCIRSRKETEVSVDKKVSERAPCYRQASDLSSERNASSATVQQGVLL